jgi:hypothetical protein
VRVVKEREGGIVRRVVLVDESGDEVLPVNRFLSHLVDSGYSPNTVCAYGYDLRPLPTAPRPRPAHPRRPRRRLPATWPWATAIVAVFASIAAIPQPG